MPNKITRFLLVAFFGRNVFFVETGKIQEFGYKFYLYPLAWGRVKIIYRSKNLIIINGGEIRIFEGLTVW